MTFDKSLAPIAAAQRHRGMVGAIMAVTAITSLAMAGSATASTKDNIRLCSLEIMKNPAATESILRFKKSKGARKKLLKFELMRENKKQPVICVISKGVVQEIIWPE